MKPANGFTLLEILVALLVFGLLLAGLTQGIHYGLHAWQSQVRSADSRNDLDAADRALRHMIEAMDPGDGIDPAPITATRDRLEFISALPNGAGTTRHVQASLFVDPSHRLVVRWRPYFHAQPLGPAPAPSVTELLPGVSSLELAFWQPAGGWITTWHYPDLPALVRIRIVFLGGYPRHWPDIVVAPQIERP
jgi:general secretion pathway protein J